MKRAVVISFNWETGKTMHTTYEGDGCASKAAGLASRGSYLWNDFPEEDGWTHFCHWNHEAGVERGEQLTKALCGETR